MSAGAAIELTETPLPAPTQDDIAAWLVGKFDGTHPEFGVPDAQTIYTIYYPNTTRITNSSTGASSCNEFYAYHDHAQSAGGAPIVFAVVAQCSFHDGTTTGADAATVSSSHEWVEATTDPFPGSSSSAYSDVDDAHVAWSVYRGGEVGDLCFGGYMQQPFVRPADLGYLVQRTWSNVAALAGHDPCVPSSLPYFNAAPALTDRIGVAYGGKPTRLALGIVIPVGQPKTIDLDLFSDAQTSSAWRVGALALGQISVWLDRTSGVNGEKLHLTMTTVQASQTGWATVLLTSALGNQTSWWAFTVATPLSP